MTFRLQDIQDGRHEGATPAELSPSSIVVRLAARRRQWQCGCKPPQPTTEPARAIGSSFIPSDRTELSPPSGRGTARARDAAANATQDLKQRSAWMVRHH